MHPRTGGYIGDPSVPIGVMATQLAHAWGVPSLGAGSASTDSPYLDWQAGSDAGLGTALIPLAGAEVCGYMALTGSSMILYPEKVILDHELCQGVYEYFRRFEFNPADMALDVIADVGPRGHFLLQKHTRDHFRSIQMSPVLYQYDASGNLRDPREMALREFKRINKTHHPRPLPKDVSTELDRILAAAEVEADDIG
jgi:trimethylamine--corrinoid protein Co-methyltransferase